MSSGPNIILCGFMGTGKSTVARIIAERLGWAFEDTDRAIEARQGKTISAIFAESGEAAFRAMERALCEEIPNWRHVVIATGGGIVLDPANRANLVRAGLVVCLHASPAEIAARLVGKTNRPLLAVPDPEKRIAELLAARAEAYGALPHHLDTHGATPAIIAERVIALWRGKQ